MGGAIANSKKIQQHKQPYVANSGCVAGRRTCLPLPVLSKGVVAMIPINTAAPAPGWVTHSNQVDKTLLPCGADKRVLLRPPKQGTFQFKT